MTRSLRKFMPRIRLFPLLLVVIALSFLLRTGDFIDGFRHIGAAFAQQDAENEAPANEDTSQGGQDEDSREEGLYRMLQGENRGNREQQQEGLFAEDPVSAPPSMPGIFSDMRDGEPIDWQDAGEEDFIDSEVRAQLYNDLAKRRRELDARERDLQAREALLKAAEGQVDQKIDELMTLKGEIESLLQKQSEAEKARVASLVKIYEGMKAQDAARIFNTLDMDVLLMVMSEMSERKTSPILAEMNAERARSITILLAQQKQLPSLPSR